MTILEFHTEIKAAAELVFDLSRSVELHLESTAHTNEKAISGKTSGLMELGETVTWRAKHFGIYLTHESKITKMEKPLCFVDEMVSGTFKTFSHEHFFTEENSATKMTDVIRYEMPFGTFGRLFDSMLLRKHLSELIRKRNLVIKSQAERLQNSNLP